MIVVFDIETQDLVPENRDLSAMRISLAGVRSDDQTTVFTEQEMDALFAVLDSAELIAGFNLLGFDYKVLQRYASFDVKARYLPKTFDIMYVLLRKTDRMVGLNDVTKRTIGREKNGKGSDAPLLFKEGRMDELQRYLEQDLEITAALVEHIRVHGKLKYGHIMYKDPVEREIAMSIDDR